MSSKFDESADAAISEIVVGIIPPIIISIFASTDLRDFIWIFDISSIVGIIILILEMPHWATSYIIGWLLGIFLLASTDLLTITDILICIILIGILVFRFLKWIGVLK